MNQMGCESEESGPSIAHATERPNNMLMGKSATSLSDGDSQPARRGYTPIVTTATRPRYHVLALANTVKLNAAPAPAIAANPAVTKKCPLGRAIVTASPS